MHAESENTVVQISQQVQANFKAMCQLLRNPSMGQEQRNQVRGYASQIVDYQEVLEKQVGVEDIYTYRNRALPLMARINPQDEKVHKVLPTFSTENYTVFRAELMARFLLTMFGKPNQGEH